MCAEGQLATCARYRVRADRVSNYCVGDWMILVGEREQVEQGWRRQKEHRLSGLKLETK